MNPAAFFIRRPVATVLLDPKLDRMSPRTMPDCVSTLGPLEPSPG